MPEYDSMVQKYNNNNAVAYYASFVPTFTMIAKDDLLPLREIEFEGRMVNVPKNMDVFLQMQYGNYMQMPPLHKRVGHDLLEFGEA